MSEQQELKPSERVRDPMAKRVAEIAEELSRSGHEDMAQSLFLACGYIEGQSWRIKDLQKGKT